MCIYSISSDEIAQNLFDSTERRMRRGIEWWKSRITSKQPKNKIMSNYLNISRTISDASFFHHFACIRINQTVWAAYGLLWCGQCWTCSWTICCLCSCFRLALTYIWHIAGLFIWLYGFNEHRWNICESLWQYESNAMPRWRTIKMRKKR